MNVKIRVIVNYKGRYIFIFIFIFFFFEVNWCSFRAVAAFSTGQFRGSFRAGFENVAGAFRWYFFEQFQCCWLFWSGFGFGVFHWSLSGRYESGSGAIIRGDFYHQVQSSYGTKAFEASAIPVLCQCSFGAVSEQSASNENPSTTSISIIQLVHQKVTIRFNQFSII